MNVEQTAGQVEQKTQPSTPAKTQSSTPSTIAHNDPVERNNTESRGNLDINANASNLQRENLDINANTANLQRENASTEKSKETSASSATKPVIALKRIIKQQHIWGFHGAVTNAVTC